MKSSHSVSISADAQQDYRGIVRYTRRTWGAQQSLSYGRRLVAAMQQLGQYPFLGESRDDLGAGLRSRLVGQHVVYYRVGDDAVVVERVLHQSMDPGPQLRS